MVRIIAGSARGFKIKTIASDKTKPTLDRVREAMFSILSLDIAGRDVLDLFAGNGCLGIEALSRGAASVFFNDSDRECCNVIRDNVRSVGFQQQSTIHQADYKAALKACADKSMRFGLVLLDPPYAAGFIPDVLRRLSDYGLYLEGCAVMCEHAHGDILPEQIGVFRAEKSRKYGTVELTLYRAEVIL